MGLRRRCRSYADGLKAGVMDLRWWLQFRGGGRGDAQGLEVRTLEELSLMLIVDVEH